MRSDAEETSELADWLRRRAEKLELLASEGYRGVSPARAEEESDNLQELVGLTEGRLVALRLKKLQTHLEDVEQVLYDLKSDRVRRQEQGRPAGILDHLIAAADQEKQRLQRLINATQGALEGVEARRPRRRSRPRPVEYD
ncbi:MAG: hypothetical protein AB1758_10435, partial [Candidatus Eremiobacterota bacterium]